MKIIYKHKVYKVYGTTEYGYYEEADDALFLIYRKGKFTWVISDKCKPYKKKKKKHKKPSKKRGLRK